MQSYYEGAGNQVGEEGFAEQRRLIGSAEGLKCCRWQQLRYGIIPQECAKER
jgi:hypothetical protein